MTSGPVSPRQAEAALAPAVGGPWMAQGFAREGERFLAWFKALGEAEPAFSWAALFGQGDGQARALVQTQSDDARADSLVALVATSAGSGLKLSVLKGAPASLTAMAVPLAGTDFICVALLDRKLIEATRLSNFFEVSADQLARALAALQPEAGAGAEPAPFFDADLVDLLVIDDDDLFAQELFSRLAAALDPDQALLAHLEKGRVTVLRTSLAADPLPAGSRAGRARVGALHAAARSSELVLVSHTTEPAILQTTASVELANVTSEESVWRAMTLALPSRGQGRLVWLAAWDAVRPDHDGRIVALLPRLERLSALLEAARPARRRGVLDRVPVWIDPRGWRFWTAIATAALAFWLLLPAPFHVIGEASLRSSAQRALVAPRDGFLSAVHARPGDTVEQGQVLAEFDTRELVLRQSRIEAQIAQAQSRRMGAMAGFNTAMVQIADAEIDAMSAERDLIALLLAQSRLIAEEDAVVVSGDMAERVGTAMRHGEPMFDLAPLSGFMVAIDIPQRDVTEVAPGQAGQLKLTALPFDTFPIALERVSLSSDGQTGVPGFVGLARLDVEHEAFRSGMQGVAQIEAGQSLRAVVLLRDFVFWAQMQWWRWVP